MVTNWYGCCELCLAPWGERVATVSSDCMPGLTTVLSGHGSLLLHKWLVTDAVLHVCLFCSLDLRYTVHCRRSLMRHNAVNKLVMTRTKQSVLQYWFFRHRQAPGEPISKYFHTVKKVETLCALTVMLTSKNTYWWEKLQQVKVTVISKRLGEVLTRRHAVRLASHLSECKKGMQSHKNLTLWWRQGELLTQRTTHDPQKWAQSCTGSQTITQYSWRWQYGYGSSKDHQEVTVVAQW